MGWFCVAKTRGACAVGFVRSADFGGIEVVHVREHIYTAACAGCGCAT